MYANNEILTNKAFGQKDGMNVSGWCITDFGQNSSPTSRVDPEYSVHCIDLSNIVFEG
jgi:hypothetical protein